MSYPYPMDGFYPHPNYYSKSFCEEMTWRNWRESAFVSMPQRPSYRYDYYSSNYGFPFGNDRYMCSFYPSACSYPSSCCLHPSITGNNAQEEVPRAASKKDKEAGKKGRPTKNPVWSLFRRINEKNVICCLCYKIVKSACATNMTKHVERHHSEYAVQQALQKEKEKAAEIRPVVQCSVSRRQRKTKHPVWTFFKRDECNQAHCRLCCAVVRSPCSSNFMGHLNRHHPSEHAEVYKMWAGTRGKEAGRTSSVSPAIPEQPEDSPIGSAIDEFDCNIESL